MQLDASLVRVGESLNNLPEGWLRIDQNNIYDLRSQDKPYIKDIASGELVIKPNEAKGESGQFFVKMPEVAAAIFPGSVVQPEELLETLGYDGDIEIMSDMLLGESVSEDLNQALLDHQEEGFRLRVLNGTFSEVAIELSERASKIFALGNEVKELDEQIKKLDESINNINGQKENWGAFLLGKKTQKILGLNTQKDVAVKKRKDLQNQLSPQKGKYQEIAYKMYKPMLDNDLDHQDEPQNPFDIDIWEDCLATADTIAGVVATLKLNTNLESLKKDKVKARVNLVNATAQGIMYLRKFARENDIDLEINTAQLTWGLSEGQEAHVSVDDQMHTIRAHANYLVYPQAIMDRVQEKYPEKIKRLKALGNEPFVVGDMGDNFESLPLNYDSPFPWNKWRFDGHGERVAAKSLQTNMQSEIKGNGFYDTTLKPKIFLRNGGYILQAFHQYTKSEKRPIGRHMANETHDPSHLSFSAKRVIAVDENGNEAFGVLVYGLYPNILPN